MNNQTFEIKKEDVTLIGNIRFAETPKAKIILVHGMAEHSLRYIHFAEFLASKGFSVFFYDQRGHGKTAGSIEKLGFFAENNGWDKVADDLNSVVEYADEVGEKLPIFVFGHSMGSFISRTFTAKYGNKINGLVLSGTAGSAGFLASAGLFLTKLLLVFNSKDTQSPLMDKLSFGDFNKVFKPNRTGFDWLSRDESEVDKYVNDPYCGTVFSIGFFYDLIANLEEVNRPINAKKFPNSLPLYIYSGENDPVSKQTKQLPKVIDLYKSTGSEDVTVRIYPKGRHEMHNELNKLDVYEDVANWLNSKI